ncbi:hypothetical protein POSPLADRAFT_1043737 [Postia placenta MAD-698-R-SB12]|uniref:Uncharacterized protein n=1 Tax=Postia placenta MAD-698-R-SB12 TaxID=670580 RepID=A0A1X6NCE3_9APHY|nr:hypothetical protein POSPLADRAFT_1043737 [Postia placenta MAD-698-R-SB12]OSX66281.1 hypothetical protein POSPLADRAFT_1043737 [Postia placenta MAD-698-R-SB12]
MMIRLHLPLVGLSQWLTPLPGHLLREELGLPEVACFVTDFARAVHQANDVIRSAPLVALESFQIIDPNNELVRGTLQLFGHQFLIASVRVKNKQHPNGFWTYVRMDFAGDTPAGVGQYTFLNDDFETLRSGAKGLGRLSAESQPTHAGPSLDSFASLLEIVYAKTPRYDVFSRNCMWHTENVLFSTARKFAQHWLAGDIRQEALRRYTAGQSDAVTCATELSIPNPVLRWWGATSVGLMRGTQAFFTSQAPDRIKNHDDEVRGIVEAWNLTVQASS